MEALLIASTEDTPKIAFDPSKGLFEITSRSLPEDANTFYSPIAEWLQNYSSSPAPESNFVFHFDYISTSSTKQLMRIFAIINTLAEKGKVNIVWRCDRGDDDMLQTGKRMQKLSNVSFTYEEA
jgi:hypothetical protein